MVGPAWRAGADDGEARMTTPVTKTARQARIADILAREQVHSQDQLAALLRQYGLTVAQATLSRDLDDLGVVRLRAADGKMVYALPGEPGGPGSRPGAGSGAAHAPALPVADAEPLGGASPGAPPGMPAEAHADSPVPADAVPADAVPADMVAGVQRLARFLSELLTSAEASANLVVLRTPAGAAQFLASVIDHVAWHSILGTVAGDDTVLVIARDPAGGAALAAEFLRLAERRR
jgi:transcriptional regulator of arginine metabolism